MVATPEATATPVLLATPWVAILALIGAVQVVRGEFVDAGVFGVVAVLLLADAFGLAAPLAWRPRVRTAVLAVAALLGGVVLVLAPRHGTIAMIALIAIGLLVLPIAWFGTGGDARPRRSTQAALRRSAIGWGVVTVALCLWELASFLLGRVDEPSKSQHPAISDLLDPLVDTSIGRIVFVAAWIALGLLLITRRRRA